MRSYYRFDISQTTIANFHVVLIKYLVELVSFRKMLSNEIEKLFSDICLHVLAVWWVEPYNVTETFTFGLFWLRWGPVL